MPTDVSTAFPAVELLPSSVLTITLSDAGAKITTLNVHGDQALPDTGDGTPETFSDPGSPFYFGDVAA